MKKKNIQKINSRETELLTRTSKIMNVSIEEARNYFRPFQSTLVLIKEEARGLIENSLKDGKLTKINWYKDAYIINSEKSFFTHSQEFELGQIYILNASSLVPALVLDPAPGEKILDICAAPGGKTIQISKLSRNLGQISVNDEDNYRLRVMKKLFDLYEVPIKNFYNQPAQYLYKNIENEKFDKILIDAPCSGEGMINLENPKTIGFWSVKKIKRLSKLQKRIIESAVKLLKPGGTLIYSTCTFASEENEENLNWAIKNLELEVNPIEIEIENKLPNENSYIKIIPNNYMEPFFVCKMTKKGL